MLNNREIERLHDFVKKELGEDYDLFDTESYIDNEISYQENKNNLKEMIQNFKEDMESQIRDLKSGKYEEQSKSFFDKWSEENPFEIQKIDKLFDKPKVMGIISDANSGKSNLLYYSLTFLKRNYEFNLYSFGLKFELDDKKIYSLQELEQITDSVVVIDEFFNLFDLEDRNKKRMIEKTLRLIFHNNNILILSGLPENYKKFISNKLSIKIYGKCTIGDFINGSKVKYDCTNYMGSELGSSMLNLPPNKFIIFDGNYTKIDVPYLEEYDSKKDNKQIIRKK